jgi:hypothetical protein
LQSGSKNSTPKVFWVQPCCWNCLRILFYISGLSLALMDTRGCKNGIDQDMTGSAASHSTAVPACPADAFPPYENGHPSNVNLKFLNLLQQHGVASVAHACNFLAVLTICLTVLVRSSIRSYRYDPSLPSPGMTASGLYAFGR